MDENETYDEYAKEGIEELDEDETYDEEHGVLLGFMKGYDLDQQGFDDIVFS